MKSVPALRILGAVLITAVPTFAYGGGGEIADPAAGWDELWMEVLIDLFVIGGIFAIAAVYMMFKYRAKSPTDVGQSPTLSPAQAVGWILIPLFIFMADDFFLAAKGWTLWNTYRTVPENALEVKVTGSMWQWNFEYENGANSDVLNVEAGRPVALRMISDDVAHGFFLPKYRVEEDLMPGRVTYLWFYPKEPGKTFVTCVQFCGASHADMNADVVALPTAEFNSWLASATPKPAAPAAVGEQPAPAASGEQTGGASGKAL